MNKRIDIQTISAGQPRPYADSIYEAKIKFSFTDNTKLQYDPRQSVVEEVVRLFVHVFPGLEEDMGWWDPRLEFLNKTGKGEWHVKIRVPYDD